MLDLNTIILAVAATLFVIALAALMVWAFRVVETATVDQRRKLVLVRRDDVEHLVMIGGPVDMVVETGD
jgi:flagellar protein FliO/FliZ